MKYIKIWLVWGGFLLFSFPVGAQIQRSYHYGVVPTENITTFEVNPSTTAIDDSGGVSSSSLTLKAYRVINERLNWGVEVPFTRYESPEKSVNGLGDALANISWLIPAESGKLGYGIKMEMFFPTATDKRLGSGKVQASPSAFILFVLPFDMYAAVGYKHYVSLMGDPSRDSIDYGRFRLNIGYASADGWWILTNLYYYMDYKNGGREEFMPELEIGTLVNDGTAFYINGSTHAGGNWHSKDWSLGVGFKLLYF